MEPFTQTPNFIFDLMAELSPAEFKVLMVIVRKTYGYGEGWAKISFSLFTEMTGLTRQGVFNCVESLVEAGHIERQEVGNSFEYRVKPFNSVEQKEDATELNETCNSVDQPKDNVQLSRTKSFNSVDPLNKKENKYPNGVPKAPAIPFTEQIKTILARLEQANGKDRQPILVEAYKLCFGSSVDVDYSKIGWAAKQVGGAGHLVGLMCEVMARPPIGDKLAYLVELHKGRAKRKAYTNGNSAAANIQWGTALEAQQVPDYMKE